MSVRFSFIYPLFHDEKPKLALDRKSFLTNSYVGERALHVLPDRIFVNMYFEHHLIPQPHADRNFAIYSIAKSRLPDLQKHH